MLSEAERAAVLDELRDVQLRLSWAAGQCELLTSPYGCLVAGAIDHRAAYQARQRWLLGQLNAYHHHRLEHEATGTRSELVP